MRIVKFYFTGTDTTKKTVDLFADVLAQDLGVRELVDYNYSRPAVRQARPCFKATDIVVSGLPTIAGRVPNLLLPYLNRIEGKGARGICISMYGNRNVDDCLLEHRDLLKKGGLQVIAGGAFVGEHSFSTRLAAKRPDAADMAQVTAFAKAVGEKVAAGDFSEPEMPGQVPYRPYYTPPRPKRCQDQLYRHQAKNPPGSVYRLQALCGNLPVRLHRLGPGGRSDRQVHEMLWLHQKMSHRGQIF